VQRALVSRELAILCDIGVYALLAAALYRMSMIFFAHHNWLIDSQMAGGALLLSVLTVAGCALPRSSGDPVMYLLGALHWLVAFSFIPRYFWPTGNLSPFILWTAAGMLALALVFRIARQARWFSRMRGKGWQWIRDWAADQPYYARRQAQRALLALGYAEEA
jgi:hypothetical protein